MLPSCPSLATFESAVEADKRLLSTFKRSVAVKEGQAPLDYYEIGSGSVVVVIPMLAELNFLFVPLMQRLARSFRVLTYDPKVSYDEFLHPEQRADELARFLDALRFEDVHIVAWSDTAATACRLVECTIRPIRSLAFIGVPDKYRFSFPVNLAVRLLYHLPIESLPIHWIVVQLLGRFMGGPVVKPAWVAAQARNIPSLTPLFKYGCLPSILTHHPPTVLPKVPTLVVAGGCDPMVPPPSSRAFAEALGPMCRYSFLPEAEHLPTYANLDALCNELLTFLVSTE